MSPHLPTLPSWTVSSTDGVEIAAYRFGGAGPPLLIAHATGFCASMYRPMGAELADRFSIVALDFRGHGRSGRPDNDDFGWDRMADDLLAVVERIGSTPATGFGHSMGGSVLLLAEARRPGTFGSLFLFEPIVFPDGSQQTDSRSMADLARVRRSTFSSRDEALARYASRAPLSSVRTDVLEAYVEDGFVDLVDGSVRLACDPVDEARTFESGARVHTSTISGVEAAVSIVVGGDEDGPGPGQLGRRLVAALPHAELVTHLELDHLGPFQDPVLVAADLR